MRTLIIVLLLAHVTTPRIEGQAPEDGCAEVLRLTGRDSSVSYQQQAARAYVYSNYCSGSEIREGVNLDLGVSDLVNSFDLGFGSTKDKVEHVCRTSQESSASSSVDFKRSSVVVRDAIASWLECKKLNSDGLTVKPHLGQASFDIDLQRWGPDVVRVSGVHYDDAILSCKAKLEIDGDAVVVDENTSFELTDGDNWPITCWRTPQGTAPQRYPEAEISISTTAGTFRMRVPRDERPSYSWASDLQDSQDALEQIVRALITKLSTDPEVYTRDFQQRTTSGQTLSAVCALGEALVEVGVTTSGGGLVQRVTPKCTKFPRPDPLP